MSEMNWDGYTDEERRQIESRLPSEGEFIGFDGQNCDDCPGWDGRSRRCACGNRRVYWSFDGGYANAEAW